MAERQNSSLMITWPMAADRQKRAATATLFRWMMSDPGVSTDSARI